MASKSSLTVSVPNMNDLSESGDFPIIGCSDTGRSLKNDSDAGASSKNGNPLNAMRSFGVNSSFQIKSIDRELSPVKWCDREVDGVYLGKSGWVQVQQRSLDGIRLSANREKNNFSTLPVRTRPSDIESGIECVEGKEKRRPLYLPISTKNIKNAGHFESHSTTDCQNQEFTFSSSATPIISPPPAFKDSRTESDPLETSSRRSQPENSRLIARIKAVPENEIRSRGSSFEEWNCSSSSFSELGSYNSPVSTCLNRSESYYREKNQTDEKNNWIRSSKIRGDFDDPQTDETFYRNSVLDPRKSDPFLADNENVVDFSDRAKSTFQIADNFRPPKTNSRIGRTESERKKTAAEANERKFLFRSPQSSSPSSLSSSSLSSSSSPPSPKSESGEARSWPSPDANPGKMTTCENGENRENSKTLNLSFSKGDKFKMRRSRSLQLSEEMFLNLRSPKSSSGSCSFPINRIPDGRLPFEAEDRPKNSSKNCEKPHETNATRGKNKRGEFLIEAAKEVQIVSDFLSGTRSRAAARNLLLHRCQIRQGEDRRRGGRNVSREPEYGIYFLGTGRSLEKKKSRFRRESSQDFRKSRLSNDLSNRTNSQSSRSCSATARVADFSPAIPEEFSEVLISEIDSEAMREKGRGGRRVFPFRPDPNAEDFEKRKIVKETENSFRPSSHYSPTSFKNFTLRHSMVSSAGKSKEKGPRRKRDDGKLKAANSDESDRCNRIFFISTAEKENCEFADGSSEKIIFSNRSPSSGSNLDSERPRKMKVERNAGTLYREDHASKSSRGTEEGKSVENSGSLRRRSFSLPKSFRSKKRGCDCESQRKLFSPNGNVSERDELPAENFQTFPSDNVSKPVRVAEDERKTEIARGSSTSNAQEASYQRMDFLTIWKTEKRRRKIKTSIKNAEFSSGDSGIQVECAGNQVVEDSESHDRDRLHESDGVKKSNRQTVGNPVNRDFGEKELGRTESDLGEGKPINYDSEYSTHYPAGLISSSSTEEEKFPKNNSSEFDSSERSNGHRNEKSPKIRLRRSLSHPIKINKSLRVPNLNILGVKPFDEGEKEFHLREGTSEDEALSESEFLTGSLGNGRKDIFEKGKVGKVLLAEALWDHVAIDAGELPFRAGDVIEVTDACDQNWWWGKTQHHFGYFPSVFVRLRVNQRDTVEDLLDSSVNFGQKKLTQIRKRGKNHRLLSNEEVRSNVVRELLKTERDFVQVLHHVSEGYIRECKKRSDMFTIHQIDSIFRNFEDILVFQKIFLEDLEGRVNLESPHKSCVGETFLNHISGFRKYSEYCNSHPIAVATLQELYRSVDYKLFFEDCRSKLGLMKIPLDGFLLTPVQRICKYPLQLAELLKYTKSDHPDYQMVREALEGMKNVANLINERKRKMESLEKLAAWQGRVSGWVGEDLISVSSQLICQGDAIRLTSGVSTSNVTLFLFDHQIVYCKKDLLKRNGYAYKGRISLDCTEVIDLPNGKNQQLGINIRHGFKIHNHLENKWLVFSCRTNDEKAKWLAALSEERKLVAQDKQEGFEISSAARELTKLSASRKPPPGKPKKNFLKLEPNHAISCGMKPNQKAGAWFTFGGRRKNSKVTLECENSSVFVT